MTRRYHPTESYLIIRRAPKPPRRDCEPIDIGPWTGTIEAMGPTVAEAGGVRSVIGSRPGIQPPGCVPLYAVVGHDVVFSNFQLLEVRPDHDLLLVRAEDVQAIVNEVTGDAA